MIITGAPASGKSTLARRLAEHLERSAWLGGDQIHSLVVGGRVWALGEPKDEADRQTRLGNQNLVALAKNCAEAGFTPVVDWIIPDGEQLASSSKGSHRYRYGSSPSTQEPRPAASGICNVTTRSTSTGMTNSSTI